MLLVWWGWVHGVAALGVGLAGLSLPMKGLAWLALAGHARWRLPRTAPAVELGPAGEWAVPSLGRCGSRLAPQSRDGGWWVRLVLVDSRGLLCFTLLQDQVEPGLWRRLRARCRWC